MLFLSHILACYLIILGHDEKNPEKNERLWIRQNQGNFKEQPEGEYINYVDDEAALYIFSYYWVWTVITTVGYGDRSVPALEQGDVIFTLVIEFIGVIMQAILINVMANFVEGSYSFSALVNAKLEPLQLWI